MSNNDKLIEVLNNSVNYVVYATDLVRNLENNIQSLYEEQQKAKEVLEESILQLNTLLFDMCL